MAYSTAILGATLFIALLSVYNADKWQSNAAGAFLEYYLSIYSYKNEEHVYQICLLIYRFIYCLLLPHPCTLNFHYKFHNVISIVLSFSNTTNAAAKPLVTEDGSLQLDMQRIMDVASQVEFSTTVCAFSLLEAPTSAFTSKSLLETPIINK